VNTSNILAEKSIINIFNVIQIKLRSFQLIENKVLHSLSQ